jgi:RNA polymerase sigma factor (sigma-70 family)
MNKKVNYSTLSDAELAEKAKAKDYLAFFEIEHRYKHRIYWHVLKILHDIVDAEDLTARTLDAARQNLETGQYKEEGKLLNWLYGTARNLHTEDVRQKGKHFNVPLTEILDIASPAEDSPREANLSIGKALHECGRKQRLSFILYLVKNWEPERIAKRLKINARSVQANAYNGRKFILRFLAICYHIHVKNASFY